MKRPSARTATDLGDLSSRPVSMTSRRVICSRHIFSEVFEVLAHPEEERRQVVVHEEVILLLLDFLLGCGGVIDQTAAVTHFCIEELACGKRLVRLYEVEHSVRQIVVRSPRDV